uniref:Uncharacterized protein n=1 Tax=Lotharella globosa TaxID=91324 RepID=A0A6V3JZE2_9EUKA
MDANSYHAIACKDDGEAKTSEEAEIFGDGATAEMESLFSYFFSAGKHNPSRAAKLEAKTRARREVLDLLNSLEARRAASRALGVVGNNDVDLETMKLEPLPSIGSVEVAAAVMVLLWNTDLGAKNLSRRSLRETRERSQSFSWVTRDTEILGAFPGAEEIYRLVTSEQRFRENPNRSVLAALFAIVERYRSEAGASSYTVERLRTEIRNFNEARAVEKQSRDLMLAIRNHIFSLILTPLSTVVYPLSFVCGSAYDFALKSHMPPCVRFIVLLLSLPPMIVIIFYLYSLGPVMSIIAYVSLQEKQRHLSNNPAGWLLSVKWIFKPSLSDVTLVEVIGPTVILYGAYWLFFTYPYLRKQLINMGGWVFFGDTQIDKAKAREFLVEVRCAVLKLEIQTKSFGQTPVPGKLSPSSGEDRRLSIHGVRRTISSVIADFESQCLNSFSRKYVPFFCRRQRNRYYLPPTYTYYHNPGLLLLKVLRYNPALLVWTVVSVVFLAFLPIGVRWLYKRELLGDSFETRWITITFVLTTLLNGFWPVFLATMWFRKFDVILHKYRALPNTLNCADGEVYGLHFWVDLDSPVNVAAWMLFRERLHWLSHMELGYLPSESLMIFLITVPAVLAVHVIVNFVRRSRKQHPSTTHLSPSLFCSFDFHFFPVFWFGFVIHTVSVASRHASLCFLSTMIGRCVCSGPTNSVPCVVGNQAKAWIRSLFPS